MKEILVTDTLFVGPAEEEELRSAGFEVVRLPDPEASEEALVAAIEGKTGYILGGIETVTKQVIAAGDQLQAISFTGSGYSEFIPGWREATEKGIAITAATGENAASVADFALACALFLVRNLGAMSAPTGPTFSITREFSALTLGIVGMGRVGSVLAEKAAALGFRVIATESGTGSTTEVLPLVELLRESDVVSVHVSHPRGDGVLGAPEIAEIRPGAVLVNAAYKGAVDDDALLQRLATGEIKAAVDYPLRSTGIEPGALLSSNLQTAFNTRESNDRISKRVTRSMLNLLQTGDDADLVNPDYRRHR